MSNSEKSPSNFQSEPQENESVPFMSEEPFVSGEIVFDDELKNRFKNSPIDALGRNGFDALKVSEMYGDEIMGWKYVEGFGMGRMEVVQEDVDGQSSTTPWLYSIEVYLGKEMTPEELDQLPKSIENFPINYNYSGPIEALSTTGQTASGE